MVVSGLAFAWKCLMHARGQSWRSRPTPLGTN